MLNRVLRWFRKSVPAIGLSQTVPTTAPEPVQEQRLAPPSSTTPVPTVYPIALEVLGPGAATFLDVGARWGAEASWFRLKPLARLIGFEPDPVECRRLNEKAESGQETFVPAALSNYPGRGTLYVTREPACSSLYPPSAEMLARFPSLREIMTPVRTANVPLTTLAEWSRTANVGRVDFIKLDAQGAEFDILRGAGPLLDQCLGIEAELMFDPLYDGQPMFADVDVYLRSRGFTLWRIDNPTHYTDHPAEERLAHTSTSQYEGLILRHPSGNGRLVWANVIYFRDWSRLGGSARDLLVLATLLEAAGDEDGSR